MDCGHGGADGNDAAAGGSNSSSGGGVFLTGGTGAAVPRGCTSVRGTDGAASVSSTSAQHIRQLTTAAGAVLQQCTALQARLSDRGARIAALEAENTALKQERDTWRQQHAHVFTAMSAASKVVQQSSANDSEYLALLGATQTRLHAAEAEVVRLQAELRDVVARENAARAAHELAAAAFEQRAISAEQQAASTAQQLSKAEECADSLLLQNETLKAERQMLHNQLRSSEAAHTGRLPSSSTSTSRVTAHNELDGRSHVAGVKRPRTAATHRLPTLSHAPPFGPPAPAARAGASQMTHAGGGTANITVHIKPRPAAHALLGKRRAQLCMDATDALVDVGAAGVAPRAVDGSTAHAAVGSDAASGTLSAQAPRGVLAGHAWDATRAPNTSSDPSPPAARSEWDVSSDDEGADTRAVRRPPPVGRGCGSATTEGAAAPPRTTTMPAGSDGGETVDARASEAGTVPSSSCAPAEEEGEEDDAPVVVSPTRFVHLRLV